jgi:hypothetical protein
MFLIFVRNYRISLLLYCPPRIVGDITWRPHKSDETQYYGYPKTVITSDYHSHDGPLRIFDGFLDLFSLRKTAKNHPHHLTC